MCIVGQVGSGGVALRGSEDETSGSGGGNGVVVDFVVNMAVAVGFEAVVNR